LPCHHITSQAQAQPKADQSLAGQVEP